MMTTVEKGIQREREREREGNLHCMLTLSPIELFVFPPYIENYPSQLLSLVSKDDKEIAFLISKKVFFLAFH